MDLGSLSKREQEWIYNGLDCCITRELVPITEGMLKPDQAQVYAFEMAQQRPALAMMLRGVGVDHVEMGRMATELEWQRDQLEGWIEELTVAMAGERISPRSPIQLMWLFYDMMKLPVVYKYQKGERKRTVDRDALEKLRAYYHPTPLINAILELRDVEKKLGVLGYGRKRKVSRIDERGRFRSSFNIGGTTTGRWSSSTGVFGGGSNLQNITEELRRIFIADPGMKLAYLDLEGAESYGVAYLSGDENYIQAAHSGDVHTFVARMMWPELAWNGDLKKDRVLADTPFYRHYTRRFVCKTGGHASNYLGRPRTVAEHTHIQVRIIEEFQEKYFDRFPGIPRWHREVAELLQTRGFLITPLGRVRYFFDRLRDDATLRKAVAFLPQSTIADILNIGLCRLYDELDRNGEFELLLQLHDAAGFQYREEARDFIPRAVELMRIPVPIKGRILTIPVEAKVGYNWKEMKLFGRDQEQVRPKINLLDARID
jgi:DNA polymerase-1